MNDDPLVSILIPAYNATFFEQALASALRQTHPHFEVVVCDDSMNNSIRDIVKRYPDPRLRYVRNERNLGFFGNFTHCFEMARGEYIKFLNDDDMLHPECAARMVAAFRQGGDTITLVTSKRRPINEQGQPVPDTLDTLPLAVVNSHMSGRDLGNHVLQHSINFIGEPTTVMFRKDGLKAHRDSVFRIGDNEYHCLADLSLWLRLLSTGDAIYLAGELSAFRVHAGQEQRKPDVALRCITERHLLTEDGIAMGFLALPQQQAQAWHTVLGMFNATLGEPGLAAESRDRLTTLRNTMQKRLTALGVSLRT